MNCESCQHNRDLHFCTAFVSTYDAKPIIVRCVFARSLERWCGRSGWHYLPKEGGEAWQRPGHISANA